MRALPIPQMLPARAGLVGDAVRALDAAAPLFLTGDRGSGVTTFGTRLLGLRRDQGRTIHRLTGSPALQRVPFAALAAFAAQVPGLRGVALSPAALMGRVAELASAAPRTLFLDRAEHLDAASAAAIVQLCELELCEVIVGFSDHGALPEDLQRLSFEHGAVTVRLAALTLADTLVLLEDLCGTPFEMSSAQRLTELAGGNPLLVRELALEAHADDAIERHRGYLSVASAWKAQSHRVSQLLARRLEAQPAGLREAVELTAVLGELPREIAAHILSVEQVEGALAERLLSSVRHDGAGPGTLVLGAGLAPETVVSMLGKPALAAAIGTLRERVPAELLTPNMRVQLATHSRNVGIALPLAQLVADAHAAALLRQFDAVIALTAGLNDPAALVDPAAAAVLRMYRSEAFLETGSPKAALRVLEPLLAAGDRDALLFASFIEFSGLGRPDLMQRRLGDAEALARSEAVPEYSALRTILSARAGEHVTLATLRQHASDERLTHSLRLSVSAQLVAERSYLGAPADGIAEYRRLRAGALWRESPPSQRGELLHTLLIAILSDGDAEEAYLPLFAGIDWDQLALDHTTYLAATSMQRIERGEAAAAAELLAQSAALVSQRDPHLLAGFVGALDAVAAVMLGDLPRARAGYDQFLAGSVTSGQVARREARRLGLAALQALEGDDAAGAELARLLAEADARGHRLTRMRLLHEAWRLRLVVAAGAGTAGVGTAGVGSAGVGTAGARASGTEAPATPCAAAEARLADELSLAAAGVQGPFAATLRRYGAAFGAGRFGLGGGERTPSYGVAGERAPGEHVGEDTRAGIAEGTPDKAAGEAAGEQPRRSVGPPGQPLSPEAQHSALDAIIAEHVAAGRLLYAAEAAARGAEHAKARGERGRAAALLERCAAVAAPLVGVHTPSLRRVPIDASQLSEREYEVCLRAAAGRTNAEIADELFVSQRTVEGHLQRAYGKLGVADRRMLLPPR